MRTLEGDPVLVRVFFGDADKWHHQPLATALLERLRREGFAGATVLHGVAGFGAASVIHTAHLVDVSGDLPVIVEVVDTEEQVGKLMPILDEMLTGGALVTTEKVHVRKYSSGQKRGSTPASG